MGTAGPPFLQQEQKEKLKHAAGRLQIFTRADPVFLPSPHFHFAIVLTE